MKLKQTLAAFAVFVASAVSAQATNLHGMVADSTGRRDASVAIVALTQQQVAAIASTVIPSNLCTSSNGQCAGGEARAWTLRFIGQQQTFGGYDSQSNYHSMTYFVNSDAVIYGYINGVGWAPMTDVPIGDAGASVVGYWAPYTGYANLFGPTYSVAARLAGSGPDGWTAYPNF